MSLIAGFRGAQNRLTNFVSRLTKFVSRLTNLKVCPRSSFGVTLGSFSVTVGALLAYLGAFGTSSEPFRRRFGYTKVRFRKLLIFPNRF